VKRTVNIAGATYRVRFTRMKLFAREEGAQARRVLAKISHQDECIIIDARITEPVRSVLIEACVLRARDEVARREPAA
jgi:hypothetical protein